MTMQKITTWQIRHAKKHTGNSEIIREFPNEEDAEKYWADNGYRKDCQEAFMKDLPIPYALCEVTCEIVEGVIYDNT